MIQDCDRQFRMGPGGPVALDFAAIMLIGQGRDVDAEILSDVLKDVETPIINAAIEGAKANDGSS